MDSKLPDIKQMRQAIEIYLTCAFGDNQAARLEELISEADTNLVEWLCSPKIERKPADVAVEDTKKFALRLGNKIYPHMKLVLSCHQSKTEGQAVWIFSVDSHDMMLQPRAGNEEEKKQLDELKVYNLSIKKDIEKQWAAAGLLTEFEFVRRQLEASKKQ